MSTNLDFDRAHAEDEKDRLWTDSRLRMMWLTAFRGFSVSQTRRKPRTNLFGQVYYSRRWLLVRKGFKPE